MTGRQKEGVNYWENEDCPRAYMNAALANLVRNVEGEEPDTQHIKAMTLESLKVHIEHYEYLLDK